MTDIQEKSKLEVLDQNTQDLLHTIYKTNRKVAVAGFIFLSVLFIVGIFGIYQQNRLSEQNKNYIDCIVKLFTTPFQPGEARYIQELGTCNIQVVQK